MKMATYSKPEHEFMFLKTKLFKDIDIMKKIVRAIDSAKSKTAGLQLSAFNGKV